MKRKILYISMCFPFPNVGHAGGKVFNYYISNIANDVDNEVTLIAKILPSEEQNIVKLNRNIRFLPVSTPKGFLQKSFSYIKSLNSKFNPCYKYGNTLTKEIYNQIVKRLLELKKDNYSPDIIVLEWTEMLLFVERVKRIFPDAKYVATEHDVSFLRLQRMMNNAKGWKRIYRSIAYSNIKKRELDSIEKCDMVVTLNWKDHKLLTDNGINSEKLWVIAPYYDRIPVCKRKPQGNDIIFYGAMNRVENYGAAIWFIDEVLPRLKDCDVKFIVVGNKPASELLDRQSEQVIITGFVEDVIPYFEKAICLVAPLILGAGIKIKILEALSAGIPVLTNEVGIEGIDAQNGVHYFHCVKPQEYEEVIRRIINNEIRIEEIARNTRKLMDEKYDLEASVNAYSHKLYSLVDD